MNDLTTQSQETDAENNESIEHRGLETAARSRAGFRPETRVNQIAPNPPSGKWEDGA